MPKPKSLTILGVRGLKVHERTPENYDPDYLWHLNMEDDYASALAAVQALLWERAFQDRQCDDHFDQKGRWRIVFNNAMALYEKENKR